jgi:hypothetical protein
MNHQLQQLLNLGLKAQSLFARRCGMRHEVLDKKSCRENKRI